MQPRLGWVRLRQGVTTGCDKPAMRAVVKTSEAGGEQTGYQWRGRGDVIETVTVCANMPVRYKVDGKDEAAVSDRIGRIGSGTDGRVGRWGWSGQIFGNASQSAYRAMCSLYLPVRKAWLFDGYASDGAWGNMT